MIETPVLIVGGGRTGRALALALGRKGVPSLLVEQVAERVADLHDPAITVRAPWRLFGFERFDDGVTAHLMAVEGEAQQQVRAHFLAGCDGPDSRVRNFLDLSPQAETAGMVRGRGRVLLAGKAAHPNAGAGLTVADRVSEETGRLAKAIADGLADPEASFPL